MSMRSAAQGVFKDNIEVLKRLNSVDYGKEGTGLIRDLVYNPGGVFLPGPQAELQEAYKEKLMVDDHCYCCTAGAAAAARATWTERRRLSSKI